jgi:putative glutamine amidotransferase
MEKVAAAGIGRPRILVLPQILRTGPHSPGRLSAIPNQEFALIPGECLKRLWENGCEVSVFTLPPQTEIDLHELLPEFDGLLLVGGEDVDPSEWGGLEHSGTATDPARDQLEFGVLRSAVDAGRPVLGICRGCQVVNVAMGGTLVPDLDVGATNGNHRTDTGTLVRHHIEMDREWSRQGDWPASFEVSSVHHQAVDHVAPGFRPVARAPDGTIEGIAAETRPILGVQWHPEFMEASEPGAMEPFLWLARQCRARRKPSLLETR